MANPVYGMDNDSATNLYPAADSEAELPLSVMPQRPAQFAFNPQRQNSGNYAGYGGYTPSYTQGQYGETLNGDDERKSTEILGWETRAARIDMRGAKWGNSGGSKKDHASDDEDESEESTILPPALHPPPPPPQLALPSTNTSAVLNPLETSSLQQPPRHVYELSDPPVTNHTPLPSASTNAYAPSLHPPSGYAQSDVFPPQYSAPSVYSHGADGSQASYDSHYPSGSQSGGGRHGVQPTDTTYHTAVGSREPSSNSPHAPPP